jgi:hypothetical protein
MPRTICSMKRWPVWWREGRSFSFFRYVLIIFTDGRKSERWDPIHFWLLLQHTKCTVQTVQEVLRTSQQATNRYDSFKIITELHYQNFGCMNTNYNTKLEYHASNMLQQSFPNYLQH